MINNLEPYVPIVFLLTVLTTFVLLLQSIIGPNAEQNKNIKITIGLALFIWLSTQGVLSYKGFYLNFKAFPPRFGLAILPPLITVILLLIKSRRFVDRLSIETLTYLHTVRIPVELVLYWLFLNKQVPELMTFEGRNFDIVAGITAPFTGYYCFTKEKMNRKIALLWNLVSLGLLLNIVINALLSVPSPFQKFAFDQPNIGLAHFPFIWLPSFIVPTVLFSHIVSIIKLRNTKIDEKITSQRV
ncbi:MAG: hypothetical protein ACM3SR_12415 [Ignavibacteriales bacterium]